MHVEGKRCNQSDLRKKGEQISTKAKHLSCHKNSNEKLKPFSSVARTDQGGAGKVLRAGEKLFQYMNCHN